MGSHICRDCGDQVAAAPGVVHHCRVLARRAAERREAEAAAAVERAVLRRTCEAEAEAISGHGYHVSIRVYEAYGVDDPQPDPIADVWRSAIPGNRP